MKPLTTKYAIHKLTRQVKRLDYEWLDPRHKNMKETLEVLASEKNYSLKQIDNVCTYFMGKTGDEYVNSGIPIIKVRNVTGEGIDWETDFVLRDFYDSNPDIQLEPEDLVLTCIGEGTIGRVDIFEDIHECVIAADVGVLRVDDPDVILPRYILHYLRSVFGQMQIERYTTGSTGQTHLRDVEKIWIVYPNETSEQEKIIEYSELAMFSALENKKKYEENQEHASIELPIIVNQENPKYFLEKIVSDAYRIDYEYCSPRHALLLNQMKDHVSKNGYSMTELGVFCTVFRGRGTSYVNSGIPIIKVRNVTGEGIDWETDFVLRDFYDSNPDIQLQVNDVLVSSTGEGTIGRVDMFYQDIDCITDGHVTTIRVNKDSPILPHYLQYFLRSVFGQMQIERYTTGSTGQTELNEGDIKKIRVIYPEAKEEQESLIKTAQTHQELSARYKQAYQEDLQKAKTRFIDLLGLNP